MVIAVLFTGICTFALEKQPNEKQIGEITTKLEKLFASKTNVFLSIEEKDTDKIIRVYFSFIKKQPHILVNIGYYPSVKSAKQTFKQAKIKIPFNWTQTNFEAGTFVEYHIPKITPKELAIFINDVFIKFFKSKNDYQLSLAIDSP